MSNTQSGVRRQSRRRHKPTEEQQKNNKPTEEQEAKGWGSNYIKTPGKKKTKQIKNAKEVQKTPKMIERKSTGVERVLRSTQFKGDQQASLTQGCANLSAYIKRIADSTILKRE